MARRLAATQSKRLTRPEFPSEAHTEWSFTYANPMNRPRQSAPKASWPSAECATNGGCTLHRPARSRSSTVKEFDPGPPFDVTTIRDEGPTNSPKGPAPVANCSPRGEIMRPPGRIELEARRNAG